MPKMYIFLFQMKTNEIYCAFQNILQYSRNHHHGFEIFQMLYIVPKKITLNLNFSC